MKAALGFLGTLLLLVSANATVVIYKGTQFIQRTVSDSRVVLRTYLATFQSAATLKANESNRSIQQAMEEIVDQVEAKGFRSPLQ